MNHQATKIFRKARREFRDEWFTPLDLIQRLGVFDLDPACSSLCPNKTARRRFRPKEDGLKQRWKGRVWLNPPFSNMSPFVNRMTEHGRGTLLFIAHYQAKWQIDALRGATGLFFFNRNPKFNRPRRDLPTSPAMRVWLVAFGEEDYAKISKANFAGVLLRVQK